MKIRTKKQKMQWMCSGREAYDICRADAAETRTYKARRKKTGSLMAELSANIYVIFIFLVFPLLDLSVLGFRAFFLWFAANQAVGAACKAKTYLMPVEIPTTS